MNKGSFDVLGNIAIVKFQRGTRSSEKKAFAVRLMKESKSITTVLEKVGKFKGRLRKMQTKFVAGEKTKEALYRENGCVFRFNVDDTYFSPRLSNERKEIAQKIKKGEEVLVMFAGVAPYPIVIAKNSQAKTVTSNEINRKANKYAMLNVQLNNLMGRVLFQSGDANKIHEWEHFQPTKFRTEGGVKVAVKGRWVNPKFNVIVMPRPQLKDTFLKEAFLLSRKGTRIYYYDFCKADEINLIVEKVKKEAGKARKRIKIILVKKAGEIAPYKYRIRVDFIVL